MQIFPYLLKEIFHDFIILQGAFPQGAEQLMLPAFHHLLGGKINIQQILPLGAGQGALEIGQIFFRLLLGHALQIPGEIGNHFPLAVHITAPDAGDIMMLGMETAADFIQIFFIYISHFSPTFFSFSFRFISLEKLLFFNANRRCDY